MAGPVIIDDGGSTRIRLLEDKLDELIEVDEANRQSTGTLDGNYTHIKIISYSKTGAFIPPPDEFPIVLGDDDKLVVWSGNHRVIVTIVGGKLDITLKGVNYTDLVMHARHIKKECQYIVSNAPAIEKVTLNPAGDATTTKIFPVADANSTYTAVILTE